MKLEVTGRFSTTISVGGETRRFAAVEGQVFDLDEQTSLALLRDVGGSLRLFAEPFEFTDTETAETVVVEMVEVPAEIATPARTRQIARKPAVRKAKR